VLNTDNSIAATLIEVRSGHTGCPSAPGQQPEEVEFRGVVQSVTLSGPSATWLVSGRTVEVTPSTKIEPEGRTPGVGSCVDVRGILQSGDIVRANRIQGQGQGACSAGPGQGDELKFIGVIQDFPAGLVGDWRVGNQTVRVTADTRIDKDRAPVSKGACAEVRGSMQGSILLATRIEIEDPSDCQGGQTGRFRMYGTIEAIPPGAKTGAWRIGDRWVVATSNTVFDTEHGALVLGACVEVEGTLKPDGTVEAIRIEVKSASGMCIFRNGVVNAGSFSSFAVSAGQIVSLFGINLGPATELPLQVTPDNRVSNRLANTRVTFDGVPGPILFASQGQINVVVPCSVGSGGKTTTTVQVESNGAWSNTTVLPVVSAWPSIFTLSNSGKGRGAILNVESGGVSSVNSPGNPAPPESWVEIYTTGMGPTTPPCQDGMIVDPTKGYLPVILPPPSVTIGGLNATVGWAGGVPGLVYGIFQVNAQVPKGLTAAPNVPVLVKVGSASSQDGVTMAVK
jgi:uncharacterized protein (TIGR03437 family)